MFSRVANYSTRMYANICEEMTSYIYMKIMTCKQLGGACDKEFHAETFEEMGEMSKKHAMEMAQMGDKAHIEKMEEMKSLMMSNPEVAKEWSEEKQKEFDALPEDK